MKIGIILETKEFEKAWNAFRFAVTAKKLGHDVKVFLMGAIPVMVLKNALRKIGVLFKFLYNGLNSEKLFIRSC